jgi:hypothetical protein
VRRPRSRSRTLQQPAHRLATAYQTHVSLAWPWQGKIRGEPWLRPVSHRSRQLGTLHPLADASARARGPTGFFANKLGPLRFDDQTQQHVQKPTRKPVAPVPLQAAAVCDAAHRIRTTSLHRCRCAHQQPAFGSTTMRTSCSNWEWVFQHTGRPDAHLLHRVRFDVDSANGLAGLPSGTRATRRRDARQLLLSWKSAQADQDARVKGKDLCLSHSACEPLLVRSRSSRNAFACHGSSAKMSRRYTPPCCEDSTGVHLRRPSDVQPPRRAVRSLDEQQERRHPLRHRSKHGTAVNQVERVLKVRSTVARSWLALARSMLMTKQVIHLAATRTLKRPRPDTR